MIGRWQRVLVLAPHTDDGEFGWRIRASGEGEGGNREVHPTAILGDRGDLRGADAEAYAAREGRSWGKPDFPHAKEPSSACKVQL